VTLFRRALGSITSSPVWGRSESEAGVILVIWTVALTAILGFVALAIDMGNDVQSATNIQNAADAAATAGASQLANTALTSSEAQQQAALVVEWVVGRYPGLAANWDSSSCTPPTTGDFEEGSPGLPCIEFDPSGQTIWVEISAQNVPSLFGNIGGATVEREAYASVSSGQAALCYGATAAATTLPGECS
jgi:hypothetical protein